MGCIVIEDNNYIHFFHLLLDSREDDDNWKILSRCCVFMIIPNMRYEMLLCYNKSFMKLEEVSVKELARLLRMKSYNDALYFCESIIGLPKKKKKINNNSINDDDDDDECCIVFKSISIQEMNNESFHFLILKEKIHLFLIKEMVV